MKFTQVPVIIALLIPAIAAMPAGETVDMTERSEHINSLEARACGAAGACKGVGGGDLCNDRVSALNDCFFDEIWNTVLKLGFNSARSARAPAATTRRASAEASAGSKYLLWRHVSRQIGKIANMSARRRCYCYYS